MVFIIQLAKVVRKPRIPYEIRLFGKFVSKFMSDFKLLSKAFFGCQEGHKGTCIASYIKPLKNLETPELIPASVSRAMGAVARHEGDMGT
ncbi:MAG: hypothetical protein ACP5T2_06555 [Thermoprotei archaeon]